MWPSRKHKPIDPVNYDLISSVEGVTPKFKIAFSHLMKRAWRPDSDTASLRKVIYLCENDTEAKLLLMTWKEWIERGHALELQTQILLFEKILRCSDDKLKISIDLLSDFDTYKLSPSSDHFNYLFDIALEEATRVIHQSGTSEEEKMDAIKLTYQIFGLALFYGHLPTKLSYEALILLCETVGNEEAKEFANLTSREMGMIFSDNLSEKNTEMVKD